MQPLLNSKKNKNMQLSNCQLSPLVDCRIPVTFPIIWANCSTYRIDYRCVFGSTKCVGCFLVFGGIRCVFFCFWAVILRLLLCFGWCASNCGSEIEPFCLHPIHCLVQSCQPSPTQFGSSVQTKVWVSNSSFPGSRKGYRFLKRARIIRRTRTGPTKMVRYFHLSVDSTSTTRLFFMPKGRNRCI